MSNEVERVATMGSTGKGICFLVWFYLHCTLKLLGQKGLVLSFIYTLLDALSDVSARLSVAGGREPADVVLGRMSSRGTWNAKMVEAALMLKNVWVANHNQLKDGIL
jgi:hypothetical protein